MRLFVCLAALLTASASAQPDWRPLPEGGVVSFDLLAAQRNDVLFSGSDDFGSPVLYTYAVLQASARVPIGERLSALALVPVAFLNADAEESSSSAGIGNPYLGLSAAPIPGFDVEAGVYLPLSTDSAPSDRSADDFAVELAGGVADFEHFEAYLNDTVAGRVRLSGEYVFVPQLSYRGQAALTLSRFVGGSSEIAPEQRNNAAFPAGCFWTAGWVPSPPRRA